MQPAKSVVLIAALLLAAPAVSAQEARRQLEAHAHGTGSLAIAIEGQRLQMELETPASDIVGFEHAPRTAAHRKAIADAKARLAKPTELFKLSPEAGCKLASATVEVLGAAAATGKSGGHDHDHGHSHGKAAKAGSKPTGKAPDTAHDDSQHSEFRATYALDCANPANLRAIGFEYFKTFKGAQKLDVTVIAPKGQSQSTVTRQKPLLDLAGTT